MYMSKDNYLSNNVSSKNVKNGSSSQTVFNVENDILILRLYIFVVSKTNFDGLTSSALKFHDSNDNLITKITNDSDLSGISANDIITVAGNTITTMTSGPVSNKLRFSVIYPMYVNLNNQSNKIKFSCSSGFTGELLFRLCWKPLEVNSMVS